MSFIRPSLVLDFAAGHIDPRIQAAVRSTRGWRYDHRGLLVPTPINTPRIDHDPATGECLGLLVEESRTNLLTYSEEFDNAAWTKSFATVAANSATAPDGTTTADKLVEDTSSNQHHVRQGATTFASTNYTASIFLKAGERTAVYVYVNNNASTADRVECIVDLASGAITEGPTAFGDMTAGSAVLEAIGYGWYRLSLSITAGATVTSLALLVSLATATTGGSASAAYTGDGTSGLYIWGAQLERGAFPTSYIPTTSAAVTRAADTITLPLGEWFNEAEGTLFVEAQRGYNAVDSEALATFDDGTASNSIRFFSGTTDGLQAQIIAARITETNIGLGALLEKTMLRAAMAWAADGVAASMDGAAVVSDASTVLPSVLTVLRISSASAPDLQWNGHIRRLAYWPQRLPNADLIALTRRDAA